MITRPSIEDLLTGLKRNLERTLAIGDSTDAARLTIPVLIGLDRISDEWSTWWQLLDEENQDIEVTLASIGTIPPPRSHTDLESTNRALKDCLVEAIDRFDLPAIEPTSTDHKRVHASVLALILRMLARENQVAVAPPRVAPTSGGAAREVIPLPTLKEVLLRFLTSDLPAGATIQIEKLARLPGGASREAWIFDLTIINRGETRFEPCILMREPLASVLVSDSSATNIDGTRRTVVTEIRVVRAMRTAGLPVPEVLWADTEGHWLERPFSIARRLPGSVDTAPLRDTPAMNTLLDEYVDLLVKIHALDPAKAGVQFLGAPTTQSAALEQVDLMAKNFEGQRLEAFPAITWLIRWLRKTAPEAARVSVVHGDYRLGNFLQESGHIIAVLDWEQVHLGDAMEEIAFMYWELWTLEPIIPIAEFVRRYQSRSGTLIDQKALAWYRLFIELKMLVVLLTGSRSYFATEERQLQYSGPQTNQMVREAELRAMLELARGEPTVAFDAWKAAPDK